MTDVLVIGYGKIGRIKAFIWHSHGRRVTVYDVNAEKQNQAIQDGFSMYQGSDTYADLIVDISTPAAFHLRSLEWALQHIDPLPRSIIIEKPLASDERELSALETLLDNNGDTIKNRIVVNESYHLSSAIDYVAKDIAAQNLAIVNIRAEMSKNRLDDIANGRFVDDHLGSLGIELPHMIAMAQSLGVRLAGMRNADVTIYRDESAAHNEGFVIHLMADGLSATFESYLGDFRLTERGLVPNGSVVRELTVDAGQRLYTVQFDPVSGIERYKAKVTVFNKSMHHQESLIIDDDHLAEHLKKLHDDNKRGEIDELLAIDNAIEVSKLIFSFKNVASYTNISGGEADSELAFNTPNRLLTSEVGV